MSTPTTVEEATIAKLSAEAYKLTAEANSYLAEADTAEVELVVAQSHALEAAANAEMARIQRDNALRQEAFALAADHYHYHHHFSGAVNEKSVDRTLQQLAVWHRQNPECPMNITIQSQGGDAMDGFHLFDQLVAYSLRGGGSHKVTMTVRGYAASMAAILLQAADERLMGRESFIMIHEISSGVSGKIDELRTEVKFIEHMCDRVVDLFIERSNRKITKKQFQTNWASRDWWVDSKGAVSYGFIDRIG